MDVLLGVYATLQRFVLLPSISYKKRNYGVRDTLVYSRTHKAKQTLSSSLSIHPTAASLPLENGLIYLSAIVGRDQYGYFSDEFTDQVDCLLKNLQSTLEVSRSCTDFLLKTTVYLKNDYQKGQNEANIDYFLSKYDECFTSNVPFDATYNFVPSEQIKISKQQEDEKELTSTTQPLITYQNTPRPTLNIVVIQSLSNSQCQIQLDGIACTKILADPTISIDSHMAPLFLDENQELTSYREYILQKWDNAYDIDALNELELIDRDDHPAIYHAKLQIRLELENRQKIEMNQKAMMRHITSQYSGIQSNYPSVHATTHIPTGYTYISGVIGHLPIKRGPGDEWGMETTVSNEGNKENKTPKDHKKVRPGQLELENSAHASMTSTRSHGTIFPPLPFNTTTTILDNNTQSNHPHDIEPSPTQPVPLMAESPFTLGFDPFDDGEEGSTNQSCNTTQSQITFNNTASRNDSTTTPSQLIIVRPDLVDFAKPTPTDISLIKLIFKDKIHFEVLSYFNNFSFGPHTFEYQVSALFGLQQDVDLYEQLKTVGDLIGGDPWINGTNTNPLEDDSNHNDQDGGDEETNNQGEDEIDPDYQFDNLDDLTSIDPNIINNAKPSSTRANTAQPSPSNSPPKPTPAATTPPPPPPSSSDKIDPQIWLLRHQITLYTFAHVFSQTRQAIYNLIDIAITSNINLYTGFSKVTIYTPSLRYLPLIKYAFQLYWPHHPLNGSPTELFALSIIPVSTLPNDALVQFDITAVQHDFNKPFLFKHIFESPPRYYSGINNVLWHSLFYLIYPDETPEGQLISSMPLYLNDTINRLAKKQYETPSENIDSVKRGQTEFANTQRSEYYYNQLLRQAQTREVVTTDRIYTPYYNNPLMVYEKIIEQKQIKNPEYIAAEQRRIAALQSTSPRHYDPFQDENLQASVMDNNVVEALINKKELKLSLTELNYKRQNASAQAITYNIIPLTYEQRVRFYHLTVGCYPRSVSKPPIINTIDNSSNYFHSTLLETLFSPITYLFTSTAALQQKEHFLALSEKFIANRFDDSVVSDLTLTEPVSIQTVSNTAHQSLPTAAFSLSSLNPFYDPDLDEKWYNYKYDGQYYKPQQQYFDKGQLYELLIKQNQMEKNAIKMLLSQMQENELEITTPFDLPQRDDNIGDSINNSTSTNSTTTTTAVTPTATNDKKKKNAKIKKKKSSRHFSNPNVPSLDLQTFDSDDGEEDTRADPERQVKEANFTTHSLLYSEQYGFPCSALTAVTIEDKLKYCLKYGQTIANSSLNGVFYGSRGVTPGTVYSSAFIGMNYIQLYGSLFKLFRVLKEDCALVKITFIVANNNKNQRVVTRGLGDNIATRQNGTILEQKLNYKILTRMFKKAQSTYDKALEASASASQSPVSLLSAPLLPTNLHDSDIQNNKVKEKNLILTKPKPSYDCFQFMRYFQIYVGTRLLFARNPQFQDKSRMFSDFKYNQRPVITTFVVDSLPNGAKYHIEAIGVYK